MYADGGEGEGGWKTDNARVFSRNCREFRAITDSLAYASVRWEFLFLSSAFPADKRVRWQTTDSHKHDLTFAR